jgi:CubicO group peptidase (beta-lactamase class C family)
MPQTEFHAYWIAADGTEGECGDVTARFPYWSFTKTVIAICALKLCADGVIDLDARLDDENYTLPQLLHHTVGLPDYGALPEYRRGVAQMRRLGRARNCLAPCWQGASVRSWRGLVLFQCRIHACARADRAGVRPKLCTSRH